MEVFQHTLMTFVPIIWFASLLFVIWFAVRRNKPKLFWAFAVLLISSMGLTILENTEFWSVDVCLDMGGRYDYEQKACKH